MLGEQRNQRAQIGSQSQVSSLIHSTQANSARLGSRAFVLVLVLGFRLSTLGCRRAKIETQPELDRRNFRSGQRSSVVARVLSARSVARGQRLAPIAPAIESALARAIKRARATILFGLSARRRHSTGIDWNRPKWTLARADRGAGRAARLGRRATRAIECDLGHPRAEPSRDRCWASVWLAFGRTVGRSAGWPLARVGEPLEARQMAKLASSCLQAFVGGVGDLVRAFESLALD